MSTNLDFQSPSPFSSSESYSARREDAKRRLAATYRIFAAEDLDNGLAGHLTVRDPEHRESFWIAPFGMFFGHVRVSDLIQVGFDGTLLHGDSRRIRRLSRAATFIHSGIYQARPDVDAVCHAHSFYGQTWSSLGRVLDPILQDFAPLFGDHGLYAEFHGPVLSDNEGERIAAALGKYRALILQNHGLLSVGGTIDEAAWLYITMERCCRAQLLAEAAGKPKLIPLEEMQKTHDTVGDALGCWLSFQPLFDEMVVSHPELLE